jgi:hypothetical protein
VQVIDPDGQPVQVGGTGEIAVPSSPGALVESSK